MKFLTSSLLFQILYLTSVFAVCPDLGNCCTLTGVCPSNSCAANGLGKNETTCTVKTCAKSFCRGPKNINCTGNCVGIVKCGGNSSGCSYEKNVCLYNGTKSNDFKICQGVQNCVVSNWTVWTPCIKGKTSRTRNITTPAVNGGKCPDLIQSVPCEQLVYICVLNTTQPTTICKLPNNLGNITVQNVAGYTEMRFKINIKGEYKS